MPPSAPTLPSRHEFDETAYLLMHPDVASAIAAGTVASGWHHYTLHGWREGRRWTPQPDAMHGVSREISPADGMFLGDGQHYFDAGASALHCVQAALFTARRRPDGIRRILDLPCGHGRVLRFLRAAFPSAEITACDLDTRGVLFCAEKFAAVPAVSREDPRAIPLTGSHDLIWCGSLLTHLPEARGRAFLDRFREQLAPGGVLVFTLHGAAYAADLASGRKHWDLDAAQIATLLEGYRGKGFGYADYAKERGYGFSLTHPGHVLGQLLPHPDWRVISCVERGWDDRQDVFALQKNFA
jgi:SAM-dependent methyltransferase